MCPSSHAVTSFLLLRHCYVTVSTLACFPLPSQLTSILSRPLESFHDTWLPLYQERPALTNTALCSLLLPLFLSYYVMATLVQLPGTKLIRAAILPVVLWFAVRAGMTLDFSQKREEYAHSNHSFTVSSILFDHYVSKLMYFGCLVSDGYLGIALHSLDPR